VAGLDVAAVVPLTVTAVTVPLVMATTTGTPVLFACATVLAGTAGVATGTAGAWLTISAQVPGQVIVTVLVRTNREVPDRLRRPGPGGAVARPRSAGHERRRDRRGRGPA